MSAHLDWLQPSLEIFAFHPMLNRWVEVGNSGMFRPEMLEPMGFPKDVRVHGWGLSLERPTMIRSVIHHPLSFRCFSLHAITDTASITSGPLLGTKYPSKASKIRLP